MAHVLVISLSDLRRDPRVDRQIEALRAEHRVTAAAMGPPRHHDVPFVDLRVRQPRRNQIAGLLRHVARRHEAAYWGNSTIGTALRRLDGVHPDVVVANDVEALPLGLRVAGGAPTVLDAHEYSPRQLEHVWWWRWLRRPALEHVCRTRLPLVGSMTTVSDGVADEYARRFGVERPTVVINAPRRATLRPSPVSDPLRMVHWGVADPARRLETMIELMQHLDRRFRLDFLLVGAESRYGRRLQSRASKDDRIRFLDPVPMDEIVRNANRYDIGLYLLPPGSFNQRHALPNKLFEFIQARLAVAIGPSPEMARVVREHCCGVVAADFAPASLAAALSSLTPEAVARFKQASHEAAADLSAEAAADAVRDAVRRVLPAPSDAR